MPKVGKNVYKRRIDNRWEGRIKTERKNGRTRYISVYGHSYNEVRCKMDAVRTEIVREAGHSTPKENHAFKEIADSWLDSIRDMKKETTIIKYEDLLRCYLLPSFAGRNIADITTEDLENCIIMLRIRGGRSGKGLSPSVLTQILSVVCQMRKYAIRNHYAVGYCTDTVLIKRKKPTIRVLNETELKKLVNYLAQSVKGSISDSNTEPITSMGIMISLFTGIREGELCALKWDAINLKERTMKITGTMKRVRLHSSKVGRSKTKVVITEPKSECSARLIPLPDKLIRVLKRYYKKGCFVLSGSTARYIEPRALQYRFKRVLKECGIADANFHALRHTFATTYVEKGFDIKILSEILGHSSVTVTMDRYVHPTRESMASNMAKLADCMFGMTDCAC